MKLYKDNQNNIYGYEQDGSQDHLIGEKVALTQSEIVQEKLNLLKMKQIKLLYNKHKQLQRLLH